MEKILLFYCFFFLTILHCSKEYIRNNLFTPQRQEVMSAYILSPPEPLLWDYVVIVSVNKGMEREKWI